MKDIEMTQGSAGIYEIEKVLIAGDLAVLNAKERVSYYNQVCGVLGLNILTRPFEYIILNSKTVLYATKSCAEQLRRIYGVSITSVDVTTISGICVVKVTATDKYGRSDSATGAVSIDGLKGEALANAMMKAETKAKRRVTLSICGLGMLDETEVETIPNAVKLTEKELDEQAKAKEEKKQIAPPVERQEITRPCKYAIPDATENTKRFFEKRGGYFDEALNLWLAPAPLEREAPKLAQYRILDNEINEEEAA